MKKRSIILIDDDPFENLLNKKLIERLEIASKIHVLGNGFEGMNYLRILSQLNKAPDVIFLDLNMPIMNGFEFLREFQSLPWQFTKNIKVIVLTSSENANDFRKAKIIGCDGYIIKPLTIEKIKEEYDKVLSL